MPDARGPRSPRRARALAADLEPLLLLVAFVVVWLLGFWGQLELESEQVSVLDAAYRAVQGFVLEGVGERPAIPWQLHVFRFAAPAVLGYAAIRGLLLLARGQVSRWRARLFARDHVVIVGDSATAQAVAAKARGLFPTAVRVAGDETTATAAGSQLATFPGPVTDALAVAQARPDRARHVVVATGDDAENLEAMTAVQRALRRAPRRPVVHVELGDAALWRELHALALGSDSDRAPVEFFNLADRESRALLDAVGDMLDAVGDRPVVVSADERSDGALVSHLVRRRGAKGVPVRIVLLGEDGDDQRGRLLKALPWLAGTARIDTIAPADLGSDAGASMMGEAPLVLVNHALAASALTRATLVAHHVPGATIAAAISDPEMREALVGAGLSLDSMRLVPTQADALGAALFGESSIELIARAKHDDYVARELAEGRTASDNPSLVPWAQLPDSLRESNRLFARSVAAKLGELGARIVPLRGAAPVGDLQLDEARLDELARGEHDRWMADLVAHGWRSTDGPKDPDRKLHPLLVGWEQLTEEDRDKDRDAYRALPALLARAGYEVVAAPLAAGPPAGISDP